MKKYSILTGILTTLFLTIFSSCNNLDLSPISNYNAESFYKTQSDFKLAVNGIYDKLQDLYYYNVYTLPIEGRSDNVNMNTGYDAGTMSKFIDDATTGATKAIWQYCYQMIDRSNAVIDKIDAGTFTTEAYRNYYKGEAYFLRGYAYFQLGFIFGGVPLIDKQMTVSEIAQIARSTQDETFTFAAKDLAQAATLLPDVWPASSEVGKATKYAAKGILARMYLFQKKYADAKPLLSDIISSGKYAMATNYGDCFIDKYDNSPEHLFQIQYKSGNVGEGNILPVVEVPEGIVSTMFPQGGGSPFLYVSSDLYDSYETGDLRRDWNIQKGYTGKGNVVDQVTCFYIKFGHGTIPATKDDYEVNLPILRYTDVLLMYAEVMNEAAYASSGDAFTYLNAVRKRAGLAAKTATDLPDQASFRTAIFNERRWEFADEFLRWFDIVRSGNATTIMNKFLSRTENGTTLYKMKDTQTIFPIPQYELDINKDTKIMWQNPGY
ncbi:MAG TPA: RagB/SusD family nutrient uptake outer membrane protein [Prolixibacteraceae bacterium]|nr:RagB/SusD family nutrient uptake outer membrane protein [Prolixibacteraceae bacterium]